MTRRQARPRSAAWLVALACAGLGALPANAFRIELKDVAPDRIERQRAAAMGEIPLPGTPNAAQFDDRLKERGLAVGNAVFLRVFKAESELEVWLQKGERYELFATYPICHWSGTLGPKVNEGDKQSPEGVYTISQRQLHMIGRHPRSLNLGFPNVFDRQFQRTGSYILIHGGCGSVGCFAMTNPVIEEIFKLSQAALKGGQEQIHVHVFPFRLTEQRLRAYALHEWYDFWRNLKDVYDSFEATRRPPRVSVCAGRYWVDGEPQNATAQSVAGSADGAQAAAARLRGGGGLVSLPNGKCEPELQTSASVVPVAPVAPVVPVAPSEPAATAVERKRTGARIGPANAGSSSGSGPASGSTGSQVAERASTGLDAKDR